MPLRHALAIVVAVLCACAGRVQAANPAAPSPLPRDPWVPPAVRAQAAAQPPVAPTRGAALQAQVERKLRAAFDAADTAGAGRITEQQARAAGFSAVADAFERIDLQHRGSVSFDEVKRYLRARGARNL
jgi:hypothetical protein